MKPIPTETATDVGSVGKWLGAAAAGALLMYLLDPERGAARRSRAVSAVRDAGAHAGASVDHALHSAGEGLAHLKDSAAGALTRGAGRVQAKAAPLLDQAERSARNAAGRIEEGAGRARERFGSSRETGGRNSYESNGRYASDAREGGLSQWLHGLGESLAGHRARPDASGPALLGGSVLGVLGLMRRSPGGLLVGLAGLALLMHSARNKPYKVGGLDLPTPPQREQREGGGYLPQPAQQDSQYLH
ncbi:hypothetical protein [Massilia yuzhufengensis]|uniref:YtxH-like protein n=1 Tax=Massilia yuzhufengensis TaxID=1164594 RepID=A0A1I1QGG4_9BURK|nr:hypothetical protein [Massilia yuzhufengensis]SFD21254.1 hypothetical protein SAMN05216204_11931 [Massilia yuzhufengensis]